MSKEILGLVEKVKICGDKKCAEVLALIDSGATSSSIDIKLASSLGLRVSGYKKVKSKTFIGDSVSRPTVRAKIIIKGKEFDISTITLADRSNMTTLAIIGRDVLYGNFIVDVSLHHNSQDINDVRDVKIKEEFKKVEMYEI